MMLCGKGNGCAHVGKGGRAGSTVGIHRQHRIPNIIDIEAARAIAMRIHRVTNTHTRIM